MNENLHTRNGQGWPPALPVADLGRDVDGVRMKVKRERNETERYLAKRNV